MRPYMVGRQTIGARTWIGTKEAAEILGVSQRWLRLNFGSPGWPRYYRVGNQTRWVKDEFMAWRERGFVHPPPAKENAQCTSSS
jgi:hypothetical protein